MIPLCKRHGVGPCCRFCSAEADAERRVIEAAARYHDAAIRSTMYEAEIDEAVIALRIAQVNSAREERVRNQDMSS